MKIFLTGGSGFIGNAFIKLATKKNNQIFAISRKKQKQKANLKWLRGGLDSDWSKYFKQVDILVHMASAGVQNKKKNKEVINTNVTNSLKLVKNAIKSGCKKFLIISSSSEYGNYSFKLKKINKNSKRSPKTPYAKSKARFTNEIKKISKKNSCKFRVMRLFPVFGEGEGRKRLLPSLREAAKKGKNFKIQNPKELRDFTDIKFVSKVLLDACKFKNKSKKFEIYHVSSNKPKTVSEFAKIYWKKFNAKGKLIFSNEKKIYSRHLSDISSTWKVKTK